MVPDPGLEPGHLAAGDFDINLSVFTVDGLYHHLCRGLDAVSLSN